MADPYQQRSENPNQRNLLSPELMKGWKASAERWQKLHADNRDLVLCCERIIILAEEAIDLNARVVELREMNDEKNRAIDELRNCIPVEGTEVEVESVKTVDMTEGPSGTTRADTE